MSIAYLKLFIITVPPLVSLREILLIDLLFTVIYGKTETLFVAPSIVWQRLCYLRRCSMDLYVTQKHPSKPQFTLMPCTVLGGRICCVSPFQTHTAREESI